MLRVGFKAREIWTPLFLFCLLDDIETLHCVVFEMEIPSNHCRSCHGLLEDSLTIEIGESEVVKRQQIADRQVQMLKMLLQRCLASGISACQCCWLLIWQRNLLFHLSHRTRLPRIRLGGGCSGFQSRHRITPFQQGRASWFGESPVTRSQVPVWSCVLRLYIYHFFDHNFVCIDLWLVVVPSCDLTYST